MIMKTKLKKYEINEKSFVVFLSEDVRCVR